MSNPRRWLCRVNRGSQSACLSLCRSEPAWVEESASVCSFLVVLEASQERLVLLAARSSNGILGLAVDSLQLDVSSVSRRRVKPVDGASGPSAVGMLKQRPALFSLLQHIKDPRCKNIIVVEWESGVE